MLNLDPVQSNVYFVKEPANVTVTEGMNVTIPCQVNGSEILPFWRINGTVYSLLNIPNDIEILRDGSLFIDKANLKINFTYFQCFILRNIEELSSQIGILTVGE